MAYKRMPLKHKIILLTLLILAGILFVAFLIIMPSVKYITTMRHNIEMTEAQIEEQYQKIRLLKKSINELDTIKENTEQFSYITIKKGEELRVIQELEHAALLYEINQDLGVAFTQKDTYTKKSFYTFTFKNSGTFEQLVAHIQALERLPYYLIIENMQFSKPQDRQGNATSDDKVTVSFSGIIYSSN